MEQEKELLGLGVQLLTRNLCLETAFCLRPLTEGTLIIAVKMKVGHAFKSKMESTC